MGQMLLIPDPKPLDERLGQRFFRNAPKRAGVYLMRDGADRVLYVGKAKNLQQRLRNYRTANPDRMPRRHLRMLRAVERIEFQFCPGETSALKLESKLIRSLKPRFNRAGVWPGNTSFVVWRSAQDHLELATTDVPEPGWQRFGPLGSAARYLHQTLARLFWLVLNPARAYADLPAGWAQGHLPRSVKLDCRESVDEVTAALAVFFWQSSDEFASWLGSSFATRTQPFERAVIESELENLKQFAAKRQRIGRDAHQLALL